MPEILMGEIFRTPKRDEMANRSVFLTDYLANKKVRGVSKGNWTDQWRGRELQGPALKDFVLDLSLRIESAWANEYSKAENSHLEIGAYARTAIIVDKLALNVMQEALALSKSADPDEQRAGKNVLFHRYFNSALSTINLIRTKNPYIEFDPQPLIEGAIEATSIVVFGLDSISIQNRAAGIVHQRVETLGCNYLSELTGLPISFFVLEEYKGLRDFMSEYTAKHGALPNLGTIDEQVDLAFPRRDVWWRNDLVEAVGNLDQVRNSSSARRKILQDLAGGASSEPIPERYTFAKDLRELLADALCSIDGRERTVIEFRTGFNDGVEWTLAKIANDLDVSRERIRYIEAKGLRKLRHPARIRRFRNYTREPQEPQDISRTLLNSAVNAIHLKDKDAALGYLQRAQEMLFAEFGGNREKIVRLIKIATHPNYTPGTDLVADNLLTIQGLQRQALSI